MRRALIAASVALGLLGQAAGGQEPVATFSILGYDPATGEVGGAVQSRVFSVGNGVLWAEAGVGAAATQAIVDVSYGPRAIELLRSGLTPEAAVKAIWDSDRDPQPERWTKLGRQFAVIDQQGRTAVYTGPKATDWAGHRQGAFCTAQGNILAGEAVVADMVKAFEAATGHLSSRLMAALEAGQIDEGLEGRARLAQRLGRAVELAQPIVAPADHDAHRAVGLESHQGRLLGAELHTSSGHPVLDEEALAMAARAAQLPALPEGLRDGAIAIRVPVVFRLTP